MSEHIFKSNYEKESKFLADKMVQVGQEELTKAADEGRLHFLKRESIPDFLKLMHTYFADFHRYAAGGNVYCNFNSAMTEVLYEYLRYQRDPRYFEDYEHRPIFEPADPNWAKLLKECHQDFGRAAHSINLEFEEGLDENSIFSTKFIDEPLIHTIICLGNGGPFGIARQDENNVPTLITYFGENGGILPEPKITYLDENKHKTSEYPKELEDKKPTKMPFEDDRMVEAILKGKPIELSTPELTEERSTEEKGE